MIPSGPEAKRLARFSFVEMKVFQMNLVRTNAVLAVVCLAAASVFANAAEVAKAPPSGEEVLATVNGQPISVRDYASGVINAMRQRFYHGKVPEGQEEVVRKEMAEQVVERMLLAEEAVRRGLTADAAKVEAELAAADKKNATTPGWADERERVLSWVRGQLVRQELVAQIERAVRAVPAATPDELRAYYERHPDLFTAPEQVRLSVIMLKIDPARRAELLEKVLDEAKALRQRLMEGADFAQLAREQSGHDSAQNGGDMGYVHSSLMGEAVQAQIDKLELGGTSEAIAVLEGVVIVRLDARRPTQLAAFDTVKEGAERLWHSERGDQLWAELKSSLRKSATVEVLDPAQFPLEPAKGS